MKDKRRGSRKPVLLPIYDWWMGVWFGDADSRIYAIFRIAFSFAAFVNLVHLWPSRHSLLSVDGMISHDALRRAIGEQQYYTIFLYADSQWEVSMILLCAGLAIISLGLGILPRFSVLIVYLWHLSFSNAAFPAINGWDTILRVFSFLMLLSPLGVKWSLPAYLQFRKNPNDSYGKEMAPRYGLVLMRYQLVLVYFTTLWEKVDDRYWRNGELMSYFQMSIYSKFPNAIWAEWHLLSAIMTYSSLAIELAIPLILVFGDRKWIAFLLGFALHGGIAISSNLGIFSLVILSTYTVFLERKDVNWLVAMFNRTSNFVSDRWENSFKRA